MSVGAGGSRSAGGSCARGGLCARPGGLRRRFSVLDGLFRRSVTPEADEGDRTPNLPVTNRLLCQLSYIGLIGAVKGRDGEIRTRVCRLPGPVRDRTTLRPDGCHCVIMTLLTSPRHGAKRRHACLVAVSHSSGRTTCRRASSRAFSRSALGPASGYIRVQAVMKSR